LDNVRLIEETKLHSEQLTLLQEITAAAASHVDLEALFEDVANRMIDGFNMDRCSIIMLSPGRKFGTIFTDVKAETAQTDLQTLGIRFEVENNLAFQEVIQNQKATAFYNVSQNPATNRMSEFLIGRRTETMVLIPFVSHGEVTGFIMLESSMKGRKVNREELRLVDQISLQITSAIDIARLFEQTRNRAERERATAEVASRIRESLDIETVLQTAAKEIRSALQLEDVTILLKGANSPEADVKDQKMQAKTISGNGHEG
jgi:GAF domain-containing protein